MSELLFASHLITQMNDMMGRIIEKTKNHIGDQKDIIFLVPDRIWWVLKYGTGATKDVVNFEKLQTILDVLKPEYSTFLSASDHGFLCGVPVLCTKYTKNVICINTETGDSEAFDFDAMSKETLKE